MNNKLTKIKKFSSTIPFISLKKNFKNFVKTYMAPLIEIKQGLTFIFQKEILFYETKVSEGEIKLFKKIHPYVKVLFDVGIREEIHYCEISQGSNIEYHFFEIRPRYFKLLKKKLLKFPNEKIFLNNIGIGDKEETKTYYPQSESLIDSMPNKIGNLFKEEFKLTTLKAYCRENKISKIDFLKTDIEGYDYFALLGLGDMLLDINFIQFEFEIGAPLSNRFVTKKDYINLFKGKFNFFLVFCEHNPMFKGLSEDIILISFDESNLDHLKKIEFTEIGFNVLAIKKSFTTSTLGLNISPYDSKSFDLELKKAGYKISN